MIADRYYYSKLTDREKKIYKALYTGLTNLENQIKTVPVSNPDKLMEKVWSALISDNPHLYYVDQSQIAYQYSVTEMVITPAYYFPKTQIQSYNQQIQDRVNKIVTAIVNKHGKNELKKETSLYDYFARHFTYNNAALNTTDKYILCRAHSILGVFLDGTAVCEGFAKAFKFMMNAMDMKCIVVGGKSDFDDAIGHAWNIVKINGKSYHVDPTWALCISEKDHTRFDYLNLSDRQISEDHRDFHGLPKCEDEDLDYYKSNGMEIDNSIYLKNYIKKALNARKSMCEFKLVKGAGKCGFTGNEDMGQIVNEACHRAGGEWNGSGGLEFKMQFVEKKKTCIVKFTYR